MSRLSSFLSHRMMRTFLVINCIIAPIATLIPIGLFVLWGEAIKASDFRGGMWYFPATREEVVYMGLFFLSILPILVITILFGIPLEILFSILGLEAALSFPLPNGQVHVDTGFVIAILLGCLFQSAVYSLPVYSIWFGMKEIFRK